MNSNEERGCGNGGHCNNCCAACLKTNSESVFSKLIKSELEFLMEEKQTIKFKPGETILKQNTTSTHVVCMKKGYAKVYIEGMKGKMLILKIIGDHDFITGGGIFANNIRHFTVSAITDVECCFIDSEKILNLFSTNSEFAIKQYHDKYESLIIKHSGKPDPKIYARPCSRFASLFKKQCL